MFDFGVRITPPPFAMAATFAGIAINIGSFREPLKDSIKNHVAPSIREQFDVGGDPPWAPLAEVTIAKKERLGYSQPEAPLIATGKLRRVAGQLNVWNISQHEAVAVNLPGAEYGRFHMTGTQHMPARPFLSVSDDVMDDIQDVFSTWIAMRFARQRFRVR